MSSLSSPRDLLLEEIKDLYSAENQLTKALARMAKAADSEELRDAFEAHLMQTKSHAQRLEEIADRLGESPRGRKCKAMEGLIAEGKDVMEEDGEPGLLDMALIGAAQKVEHYEIASYGTARTLAELIGEDEIASMLQQTLDEEAETDELLTKVAMNLDMQPASLAPVG